MLRLGLGWATAGVCAAGRARAQPASVDAGQVALHLLRTGDIGGLPWIELPIDGVATRWLVDSGASTAVVSPALAARLMLKRLTPVRVATAGGVQTVERYSLPALPLFGEMGSAASSTANSAAGSTPGTAPSAVALDLDALLGPAGGALDGVLGAPWLRERSTTFDFAAGELRWTRDTLAARPTPDTATPPTTVLPLRWDAGLPVVRLALGSRTAEDFLLDTGNAGALVVFAQRAQALGGEADALPETVVRELGGTVRARHARIDRVTAPGLLLREVPAALESGTSARRGGHFDRLAGSVGMALFAAGAFTLDGPGARLIVSLPGMPEPPPLPGGFGLALGLASAAAASAPIGIGLVVSAVMDGGPAALAGLAAGDRVLAIDGQATPGWTSAQAWQALAGRDGALFEIASAAQPSRAVTLARQRFFPLLR